MGGTYCCPYGPMVLVPTFWIAAAVTCTYYAGFECTFFQVHGLFHHEVTVTYGLWTVENYENSVIGNQEVYLGNLHLGRANSCSTWERHAELDNEDVDGALQFARISHMLACIAGGLSLLWIVLGWWIRYWTCTVYIFVAIMILAAIFMAFSFWALKSDYCAGRGDQCELDFAGYIGIVAAIFWLFAACSALVLRSDRRKKRKGDDDDDDDESKKDKRKKRKWRRRRKDKNTTEEQEVVGGVIPGDIDQEAVPLNDEADDIEMTHYRDGEGGDGELFENEPAESYLGGHYDDGQYGDGVVDSQRGYDDEQQQQQYNDNNDGTYVIDDEYDENNDGGVNDRSVYNGDGYDGGDNNAGDDQQEQQQQQQEQQQQYGGEGGGGEEGNGRPPTPPGYRERLSISTTPQDLDDDDVSAMTLDTHQDPEQFHSAVGDVGDTMPTTVDEEVVDDSVPAQNSGEFT